MASPAKKSSDEDSNEPELMIVLVDTDRNYYELSRATLERSRVPEERKEEVGRAIAKVLSEVGYINHPRIPGSIIGTFVIPAPIKYAGSYLKSRDEKR